jgi:hypothetical protein
MVWHNTVSDLKCLRCVYNKRKRAKVQCSTDSFFSPKTRKLEGQLDSPGPTSIVSLFKFIFVYVHTAVLNVQFKI